MLTRHSPIQRIRGIEKLLKQYSVDFACEQITSSVVRAWCLSNDITLGAAEAGVTLSGALSHSGAGDLHLCLGELCGELSFKDVEIAFETSVGAQRKKDEGVVYTPTFVTDAIIERCLDLWSSQKAPLFIDPACGSGGFLVRAVAMIVARYGMKIEWVVRDLLCGVDVDAHSVQCTRLMLEMFCLDHQIPIPDSFPHISCTDALLRSPRDLLSALEISSDAGFDVVATNPPYVKIQNLESAYRAALNEAFPEFTAGSFNLSQLFLIRAHQLISPQGVAGMIAPNNIFTALSSEQVRSYLQRNRCLHSVVDFGHQKIFRNASTYTCLLFLNRGCNQQLLYTRCEDAVNQLPVLDESMFDAVEVATLRQQKWRLAAPHHLANVDKIESLGTPLGELAEIRVGFATLKDSVFLIEDEVEQDLVEAGITASAIKIAAFASEDEMRGNRQRLIRPYRKQGGRWLPYAEEELRASFPRTYNYLSSHKAELMKRDKGKKDTNFFEWGRTQGMEARGPKLLTKTFNRSPQFMMDETDSLFCNGYSVRLKEQTGLFSPIMDIGLLQKILNSCVMDYYIQLTSVGIEGGYWCYQKNFIEKFCIPELSDEEADELFELEGEALQRFICQIFDVNFGEVNAYIQL